MPAKPSSSIVTYRGKVRNLNLGTQAIGMGNTSATLQNWTFKLERFDENGNALPPIPVQMKGRTIEGFMNEGDELAVYDDWNPSHVMQIKKAFNITTNAEVLVTDRPASYGCFIFIVCVIVIALIVIIVVAHPWAK